MKLFSDVNHMKVIANNIKFTILTVCCWSSNYCFIANISKYVIQQFYELYNTHSAAVSLRFMPERCSLSSNNNTKVGYENNSESGSKSSYRHCYRCFFCLKDGKYIEPKTYERHILSRGLRLKIPLKFVLNLIYIFQYWYLV